MSQNRRWINTRVESVWDEELQTLVVVSREGYWYEGDMALAHNNPSIDQDSYAFYNDGTESGSIIIGTANNPQTLESDTTYLVRFLVQEQGGASSNNFASQLEYNVNGAGWVSVTSISNNVRAVVSSNLGTDGSNTTQRLGAGTFISANAGVDNGDGLAGTTSFAGSDEFEAVFAIQFRSADLTDQDTVQLRIAGMNVYTRTASSTINVTLPSITGTLSTQETGADTASASGTVALSGSLSVQETGGDTSALSGTVTDPGITGTLAVQETGSDTASASGTVTWPSRVGTLATQETGSDSASLSGNTSVSGGLSVSETGSDAPVFSGSVALSGTFSSQEVGSDTASISGTVTDPGLIGTLSAQESGSDIASLSGTVTDAGLIAVLSAQESGLDTASISGTVTDPGLIGTLSAQEAGSDSASMSGTVTWGTISGSVVAVETGPDTSTLSGVILVTGGLAASETGADSASLSGGQITSGVFAATEIGQDTFSGTLVIYGAVVGSQSSAKKTHTQSKSTKTTAMITQTLTVEEVQSVSHAHVEPSVNLITVQNPAIASTIKRTIVEVKT